MVKRLAMLMASLFLLVGGALAQSTISGTVTSSDDGDPIVGASVVIEGTKTGTVTDIDGNFTLNVKPGTPLRISYLGMKEKTVKASQNMKVILSSNDKELNEVVVTALGIKREAKALGYSSTTVNSDQITSARASDIVSSISGTVAGVQVNNTGGDPGSSQSIVVRGYSSLSGSNQPLFVIDGVPMNNSSNYSTDGLNSGYDFGNGANAVNPDDVESMTILKSAAATALYGSRAANGVVMITTKSGRKHNKGLGVEYNGGVQWSVVGRLPQMQNQFGMGWSGDHTMIENGSWGPEFDNSTLLWGQVYNNSQKYKTYRAIKDNIRDFFDTGVRYNNSISLNNANENGSYFVSLSQTDNDGVVPTSADTYDKYTFSFRGDYKIKDLTVTADVNYSSQRNKFAETGQGLNMINDLYQSPRDISFQDLKDLDDPFNTPGYYYTPYGITNPYYMLKHVQNSYKANRTFGKLQFDYDFLKYFRATYRIGLDETNGEYKYGSPNLQAMFGETTPNGKQGVFTSSNGEVVNQSRHRREINQDFMVTYGEKFFNDKLDVNALVGLNYNERKYHYLDAEITNLSIPEWFNISNSASTPTVATYDSRRRLYGLYGQIDLGWDNMVYLTFTGRNDWSSTLPKDSRSFFYPGVQGSFVFSELFNQDTKKWFNFGKLRISWGQTGNDADVYQIDPYYSQSKFSSASSTSTGWGMISFPLNGVNAYTLGNLLGSSSLQPEISTEFDAGFNVAFFNNRINLDFEYYNKTSDKQIFTLPSDPASGYTSMVMNLGKIRNRGIETLLTLKPIVTKDFDWTTALSWTINRSKVISLPESLGGQATIYAIGGQPSLCAIVGQPLGTFLAEVPERDPEGHIVVNAQTGMPVAESTPQMVGDMNNKYTLGINTTLRYKDFSLNFVFDIRKGGKMFSRTKSINYFTGNAIQTAYNDRHIFIVPNSVNKVTASDGTVTYVENTTPVAQNSICNYFNYGAEEMGSGWLVDKSFVKLRNVSLSWDMPKAWLARTFLTGVRLSVFGTNLLCWTPDNNSFIDPEITTFGNDLEGNYGEYSANPTSRNFGFNVQVKF